MRIWPISYHSSTLDFVAIFLSEMYTDDFIDCLYSTPSFIVPTPSAKHNLFIVKSSPGGVSSSKFEFNDLGSYEWAELD